MSVRVVSYEGSGWEVDIRLRLPNGERHRERRALASISKSAAKRWGHDREQHLLQHGLPQAKKEVHTLDEFAPRFIDGHAKANRQKPSGIAAKEMILRVHLVPFLGAKRVDAITNEDVQRLKARLGNKAAKTVNNVLAVLSMTLKKAVEWGVIERMPCTIRQLPAPKPSVQFYDFAEFERLVTAAGAVDPRALLLVLLGGEAGLRSGEMVALEWTDIDFVTGQICVERSAWKGQVAVPKGGRLRHVPMTRRLEKALRDARHLRGPRVVQSDAGGPLTETSVQAFVRRAARKANLRNNGPHILRHTFCSHLAMRGGHREQSRNSRGIRISARRSGICI
jgi:integrase